MEILQLLWQGRDVSGVRARLHCELELVEAAIAELMRKLGVRSLKGLVKEATTLGLLSLPPEPLEIVPSRR